jgi:osmotically-inducible protein OsmY
MKGESESESRGDNEQGKRNAAMASGTMTDMFTDKQIERELMEKLEWDARLQPYHIGISVKDGIVTLMGWVDSLPKQLAAEEAAHRIRGVKAVANDIEIWVPSSVDRTDPEIAATALQALKWNAYPLPDKLHITVSKGFVTLKGDVEWQHQKEDPERIIRSLAGVRGVNNLIVVRPSPTPSDLKKTIEKALERTE